MLPVVARSAARRSWLSLPASPQGRPLISSSTPSAWIVLVVLILDQSVREVHAHQKITQPVAVCRCLQVHALAELPLDVDLDRVGRFRARLGLAAGGKPVAVEQLKRAGVAKTAAIQKLVRPLGTLIDQGRPGRNEIAIVRAICRCGLPDPASIVSTTSFRPERSKQGSGRDGWCSGTGSVQGIRRSPSWRFRKSTLPSTPTVMSPAKKGRTRYVSLAPDPIAEVAVAVIFHAAVARADTRRGLGNEYAS